MRIDVSPDGAVQIEETFSPGARVAIALFGLAPAYGAYELWPALWPIGPGAIIPWLMSLAALLFSAAALFAALFGFAETWRIAPGHVSIERRAALRQEYMELAADGVSEVSVLTDSWSDGPDRYRVSLATTRGPLQTPSHPDKRAIEDLRHHIARLLANSPAP